ncbi:MAG: hypothetical protein E5W93_10220 [Mesorhizobium sp.]|nr:MAG: hypothetical protein E5W93_10220 [Mesorhizobium sp.]
MRVLAFGCERAAGIKDGAEFVIPTMNRPDGAGEASIAKARRQPRFLSVQTGGSLASTSFLLQASLQRCPIHPSKHSSTESA